MIPTQSIEQLDRQFAVPGAVAFVSGRGGLIAARLSGQGAEAEVYLHGAHLTHWQPAGQEPVLWVSEQSWFEPGKPIRGGVPVCLPWFGPRPDDADSPIHGFVRLNEWKVIAASANADGAASITLRYDCDPADHQPWRWDQPFRAELTITIGRRLTMTLRLKNTGGKVLTLTEALHTYLGVQDVRHVTVAGLRGVEYDETIDGQPMAIVQEDERITFGQAMVNRVYKRATGTCVIDDPGYARRIRIAKRGSQSTVVWNPHEQRAREMPDFGDDEWPQMLCVETANAAANPVVLPGGSDHVMEARIEVEPV